MGIIELLKYLLAEYVTDRGFMKFISSDPERFDENGNHCLYTNNNLFTDPRYCRFMFIDYVPINNPAYKNTVCRLMNNGIRVKSVFPHAFAKDDNGVYVRVILLVRYKDIDAFRKYVSTVHNTAVLIGAKDYDKQCNVRIRPYILGVNEAIDNITRAERRHRK